MRPTLMDLPGRWAKLCTRLNMPGAVALWDSHIVPAYAEPHRAYHNMSHIDSCIAGVFAYMKDEPQAVADLVELTLWFHDFIYDPKRSDNEEQSAGAMTALLKPHGIAESVLKDAVDLVLMTKTHEPRSAPDHLRVNRAAYFVSDIDLSILGESPILYWAYEHAIRQEYSFVPEDVYVKGRDEVLTKLRNIEVEGRLFMVPLIQGIFNNQARQNLHHATAYLRTKPLK